MVKIIEYDNGTIEYRNEYEELHRDDGPAKIYPDETKIWFKNGKIHREDGPAFIWSNGEVFWCLNHTTYTFKEWCELVNISDELKMELVLKYG